MREPLDLCLGLADGPVEPEESCHAGAVFLAPELNPTHHAPLVVVGGQVVAAFRIVLVEHLGMSTVRVFFADDQQVLTVSPDPPMGSKGIGWRGPQESLV